MKITSISPFTQEVMTSPEVYFDRIPFNAVSKRMTASDVWKYVDQEVNTLTFTQFETAFTEMVSLFKIQRSPLKDEYAYPLWSHLFNHNFSNFKHESAARSFFRNLLGTTSIPWRLRTLVSDSFSAKKFSRKVVPLPVNFQKPAPSEVLAEILVEVNKPTSKVHGVALESAPKLNVAHINFGGVNFQIQEGSSLTIGEVACTSLSSDGVKALKVERVDNGTLYGVSVTA
jgi:hypothetical protein